MSTQPRPTTPPSSLLPPRRRSNNDDVEASDHGSGGHVDAGYMARAQWLRAAVLGANDGLVSVASLMVGVGAVNEGARAMLVSGLAGLVAGACSMAIGEFVSVYAQYDIQVAHAQRNGGGEDEGLPSPTKAAAASALAFAVLPLLSCGRGRPGSRRCARPPASAWPASAPPARTWAARKW
jgi:vacuolar iron transporter family protein